MKKVYMLFYLIFLELRRAIGGVKYFAEVDVTNNCNLRCKHCHNFKGKEEFKIKEVSVDIWKKRFNELYKKGVRFILLVGGEPALRNDVEVPLFIKKNERDVIIEELKRVKILYPKDFLLSKRMTKWYENPDHRRSCHWGDEVLHFDVSWNRRRCFGNNADCSNCGCLAGSMQNPLKLLLSPREMMKLV